MLLFVVIAVAVGLLAVLWVGTDHFLAKVADTGPKPVAATKSIAPTSGDARADAVAWSRDWLPHQATVIADTDTVTALRQAGFTHAIEFGAASAGAARVGYVIDLRDVALTGSAAPAHAQLYAHSLPLAIFQTATGHSGVRQLISIDMRDAQTRNARDFTLRINGGRALLNNVLVQPDSAARFALQNGTVDLRAETALTSLATKHVVDVRDPQQDPAEARAGQPIRSLVISTLDLGTAQAALDAMTAPYRPMTIQRLAHNSLRVVWAPTVAMEVGVVQ